MRLHRPAILASGLTVLVLLLPGCAARQPVATPVATSAGGAISTATLWYAASAEQEAVYRQTYRLAAERLEQLVAVRPPGTWAVVLDADETVLDNVAYQIWLDRRGATYSTDTWQDWVEREEATPLPGAVEFLQRVRELGGMIAIVSNRREELRAATEANLRRHDVPWDLNLLRVDAGDKTARWRSIADGTASPDVPPLDIVMWLGDNILDFPGLTQAVRDAGPEAFGDFGTRFFVFPNPGYGSWEESPLPEGLGE